jgi:DNA-binding CsgD family transcriptional regulator/tetratricopeptide (TPR) repeat protein
VATSGLLGRDSELDLLAEALGAGRHVLLGGDAGVGKTRLLRELCDRAVDDGWQVLAGHCLDFGDSAESYLPFTEILERLRATLPDVIGNVAGVHPALLRLLPAGGSLRDPSAGEAPDRGNLFAGVHGLLNAAAEKAPALVVVEDAHWADQSTRDLLTFLFARSFTGPVVLVASYRSDDLHRRHPLRRQLAEWTRLAGVDRIMLDPLPDTDVRALALALNPELTDTEVEQVVARADGNAFFTEELVEAASGTAGVVPADLADLLLIRLDRLSETTRELVRTASAAGRDVSGELLAAVAGLDQPTLDAALREAVEMGILVVRGDDYYVFRHALLGEAVYDDLLPGQRVRLHQRYVTALRSGLSTGTAAGLARHARLAGDRETALEAGIRAGDAAAAAGGPDEAAQHYQQAISLLSDMADHDRGELVALVVKAGEAMIAAGQADRAGRLARRLLEHLPGDAPGLWRAELLTTEVEASFAYVRARDVQALSEEAVASLPADAPPLVRARVYAAHTRLLMIYRRHDEAERFGREALRLAEELDRPVLAADVAVTLAGPWGRPPAEHLDELVAAVGRAEAAGALHPELRGRLHVGYMLDNLGRSQEAGRWYRSAHDLAQAKGVPWAPYAFDARMVLSGHLYDRGQWDEALALTDAVGVPAELAPWLESRRLMIELARGADVGEAPRQLRAGWGQEMATVLESAPTEMIAAERRGDVDAVVEAYDAAVAALAGAGAQWWGQRVRLAAVAVGLLADCLPVLSTAARERAVGHVRRILADGRHASDAPSPGGGGAPVLSAWECRLEAEALRARWLDGTDPPSAQRLVAAWRDVERAFAAIGHIHELAWVRAILARILRATGDPTGARHLADQARVVASRLGAQPLIDALHDAAPASPVPAVLTPRESEILALVAEGRTNGEIGRRLFISTKTVSVHVSNILGKLGAAGRTEAAAIARRRGLLLD